MDASDPRLIPAENYKAILQSVPVVCVDLLIKKGDKYLLVKRKDEPLKGQYWVPGGRIMKDELAIEAAHRKLEQETGLKGNGFKFVGYYEDFYDESAFGVPCHSVSLVFETEAVGDVYLDDTSESFKWEWGLPHRLRFRLRP